MFDSSTRPRSPRWRTSLALAVAAVATLSALAPGLALSGAPGAPAAAAPPPRSAPTALPPIHAEVLGLTGAASVDPTGYYDAEPAPMGIGDFGIGTDGAPYTYNTTQFLGNFSWQQLDLSGSAGTAFTDQLNVVLQFVQDGTTYAYWIQDVAFMDSADNELTFENNIWNFSSSASCLDNTGVQGNGTVYDYSGCEGYYAVGPSGSLPGADLTMPNPGDFGLLVRSYEDGQGRPEVAFEYWDGVTSWYVTYDNVVWPWARGISADHGFVVDGSSYNPLGLFYDAELTIGGPGGGSATEAYPTTAASSRLLYWNGHNFEAPPAVWNFGSNTAEAVSNVQSYFAHDAAGFPYTVQRNGTARNATPALAYDQAVVGDLEVSTPGSAPGTLAIRADDYPFVGGLARATVVAGTYPVWVNTSSTHTALGDCAVAADAITYVSIDSGCGPWVGTPTGSPASADLGQSVTFNASVLDAGSGGDTFAWSTSPSGLGCAASTGATLACTPTATGTYAVSVAMTDSDGGSNQSGVLSYVVHSDPTVAAPTASPGSVETGQSVTFTASPSGGASPYAYSWQGLPGACSETDTATPICRPATAGTSTISVTVRDASGVSVTSPTLSFSVTPGPSLTTPVATPADQLDLGQSVLLSTSASGGTGAYTYAWSGLPTGCASADAPTLDCTPTAAGTFSVAVAVTDADSGSAHSGTLDLAVDPALAVPTVAVVRPSVDVGQSWQGLVTGVAGGSGSYAYAWSDLPTGCASANATSVACTPTGASAGSVSVEVTDSNGASVTAAASFAVFPDPTLAGVSATPTGADVGETVTFALVGLDGGSGDLAYAWTGLPTGCAAADAAEILCVPTAAGATNVTVTVTDSNGGTAQATAAFATDPALAATPGASPASVAAGDAVTLSVAVSGGALPYSYAWSGLPTGCTTSNAAELVCAPSAAGRWASIAVTVTDAHGATVTAHLAALTVTAPAPSAPWGLTFDELYLLIGAGIVAVAGALAVGLARRRRAR